MNIKKFELNKANTKKFKKNNISLIDKKLNRLDSDINKLYKKYTLAKKERINHEKEQINIINRIKYLEDEEKKMQLKCKFQMQKINSLTRKLGNKSKQKLNLSKNSDNHFNKSSFRNKQKIKDFSTIGDTYKINSSFNDNYDTKIWINNYYLPKYNEKDDIFKISEIILNEKKYFAKKNKLKNVELIKRIKEKEKDNIYISGESSIDEGKTKLNNSLIFPKSENFFKEESSCEKISFLEKENNNKEINSHNYTYSDYQYTHRNSKNKNKSIKLFKTNIFKYKNIKLTKNQKINKKNSNLKIQNTKSFKQKKRNNNIINDKKIKIKNNSFIIPKTLTSNKLNKGVENNHNKNTNYKYSKSIEVKRKRLGISKEKNKRDINNKINRIKIIKKKDNIKNKKIQLKNNKSIIEKEYNESDNISYDFIINNDKIYYNNNEDKNSLYQNNIMRNYIYFKNEEKLKNIINNNKSMKHM